jgi:hypothetical protein
MLAAENRDRNRPARGNIFNVPPEKAALGRLFVESDRKGWHSRRLTKRRTVMGTPFHRHLIALGFALIWSSFMVWWSADYTTVNIVILIAGGILVGYLWVWAMLRIQRRREARSK